MTKRTRCGLIATCLPLPLSVKKERSHTIRVPLMLGAKHNTEVGAERVIVNGPRFQTETLPNFRLTHYPKRHTIRSPGKWPGLCRGCEPCLLNAARCRAAPHRDMNYS